MAVDWDDFILSPLMDIFGEGTPVDASSWPTYRSSRSAPPFSIQGAVYDAQYRRVTDLGDGSVDTSYHPVLGVRDAVFAAAGVVAAQGGIVFVPSANQMFAVADVQQDSHGQSLLILIEAQ